MERPTPRPILSDTESPDPEPDCEEVVVVGPNGLAVDSLLPVELGWVGAACVQDEGVLVTNLFHISSAIPHMWAGEITSIPKWNDQVDHG